MMLNDFQRPFYGMGHVSLGERNDGGGVGFHGRPRFPQTGGQLPAQQYGLQPMTGGHNPAQPFNGFPQMRTGGNHPPLGIPMPRTGGPLPASPSLGQPFPMAGTAMQPGQGWPAGMGGLARMYFGGLR